MISYHDRWNKNDMEIVSSIDHLSSHYIQPGWLNFSSMPPSLLILLISASYEAHRHCLGGRTFFLYNGEEVRGVVRGIYVGYQHTISPAGIRIRFYNVLETYNGHRYSIGNIVSPNGIMEEEPFDQLRFFCEECLIPRKKLVGDYNEDLL